MTPATSDGLIPTHEHNMTALDRIEHQQQGGDLRGVVTSPEVLARQWMREAEVFLGRVAAAKETGHTAAVVAYRAEAIRLLHVALACLDR